MNKTKYKVRTFDYKNGVWVTKFKTGLFTAAKSDRTNKRRKGEFAIVTWKEFVVDDKESKAIEKKLLEKEEREGI